VADASPSQAEGGAVTSARAVVRFEHARHGRKIINFDTGGYGVCAWDTCDRDANSLYEVRTHEHPPAWRYDGRLYTRAALCELVNAAGGELGRHIWMAFCSETHKRYHVDSSGPRALELIERTGRAYGNLMPGYRVRR
jgi:hypothetical protein